MGGKIRRFQGKRISKKSKKAIDKGEKQEQITDSGISDQEFNQQKKELSKMPIKDESKPLDYFPEKKGKKKHKHPFKKSKRTSPGDLELGKGPHIPHLQGEKREKQIESQTLEKRALFDKKMTKKSHYPKKK